MSNRPTGAIAGLGPALGEASSRSGFLRKGAIGGALLVGGGALLGRPAAALAGHSDNIPDADVLNYALTLEYLEASFYTQALGGAGTTGVPSAPAKFGRGAITGSSQIAGFGGRIRSTAYGYLVAIRNHEVAHVNFLRAGLGAAAVEAPTFTFTAALRNVGTFLATARA